MVGWTTVDSADGAKQLARDLVESGLVACAQITPGVTSVYQWEDKLECSDEWRLTLKFSSEKANALKLWLGLHHPYETPQWVAVKADDSIQEYARWIVES